MINMQSGNFNNNLGNNQVSFNNVGLNFSNSGTNQNVNQRNIQSVDRGSTNVNVNVLSQN